MIRATSLHLQFQIKDPAKR